MDFEEIRTGGGIEYWPIISFYVDGKEYKDDYPMSDIKIGNNVQIYYYPVHSESINCYYKS